MTGTFFSPFFPEEAVVGVKGSAAFATGVTNSAVVYLYKRSSTVLTDLDKPDGDVVYTFLTGGIDVTAVTNGWTANIPSGSDTLYVVTAIAFGDGDTDTILSTEWTPPVPGAEETAGTNTAVVYLYQRNFTGTAPAAPASPLTYTFATGTFVENPTPWSAIIPSESLGGFLFVTTAIAVSTSSTAVIAPGSWADPSLLSSTTATSPIAIRLTNPVVSIPTDSSGDNGVYTGSGTSIYVEEGQTALTFDGAGTNGTNGNSTGGTTAGTWRIDSRVATGVTLGSIVDSGVFATVNPISLISADTGSILYTITGRNSANIPFTIQITQNFSRLKGSVIDTTPPGIPTGLALTSSTSILDGGNVVLRLLATWNANTEVDISYYEVEISEASGSYIGFTTPTNRFEWVAKANVSYSVRVRSVDKNNNKSAYSTVVSLTTSKDTTPPSAPSGLTAVGAFENIFLSWTNASNADLTGVVIYSRTTTPGTLPTGSDELVRINALPGQIGAFTHSSLAPGTTRYYWLRSVDSSGNLSTLFFPNNTTGIAASTQLLTADRLADDALNAERLFSDNLRPVEVFNGVLPTTGNFEGRQGYLYGSTTAANNGKLWRYVSGLWTKAVDGGDITANTITAGAITAGAILASKLAIGDLSNQLDNASFELGDTLWTKGTGWTIAEDSATASRGTWRAARASGAASIMSDTDLIPVLEGDIWAAEAMIRTTSPATGGGFVRITALNSLGSVVTTQNGAQVSNTTTYTVSRATFTVPSGVSTIRVDLVGNNTAGTLYVDDVRLLRVSGTTLIGDGAITTNKMVANSISGDRITAGTLNADKIVAGTITGDRFNTGTSLPGTITVGATGVSIGTVQTNAATGAAVATNFNANNDRNGLVPTNPTIPAAGAAVDHVNNTDGSVDISFEWNYTTSNIATDANNIDGFFIYINSNTSNTAYTFGSSPANETVYTVPPDRRALILSGVPADRFYTFGVQAYRVVDTDIDPTGLERSAVIKSTVVGENPYQPSSSVAFAGNITGTINGTAAATVVSNAATGAQDPTTRINAGTTTIDPGKILISGSTTLASWRNGADQTRIEGGSIAANTISANKVTIGLRGVDISGIQFNSNVDGNAEPTHVVSWTAGTISYANNNGTIVNQTNVPSGSITQARVTGTVTATHSSSTITLTYPFQPTPYTTGERILVSGITATTNAPNGVFTVVTSTPTQTTYTVTTPPTGTLGGTIRLGSGRLQYIYWPKPPEGIVTATHSSSTITLTYPLQSSAPYAVGETIVVSGITATTNAPNGVFTVVTSTPTQTTYTVTTPPTGTLGGTILLGSGISGSTASGTANRENTIVLGTYAGGFDLVVNYGRTIIDGSQITTGTISANQIKANAITADKLSVTQLSSVSATIGTLRTATTGARTEISDNVIKVFDASNVLRVRIGNLTL